MGKNRKPKFHCKNAAQKYAIRKSYAERNAKANNSPKAPPTSESPRQFPDKFPFWARLKIGKNRTTLVIDEDQVRDKKKGELVDGYVHREATHSKNDDFEEIFPNPDSNDPDPMYLKRPRKFPKRLFKPHTKDLDMPEKLRERYDKNNHKDDEN